MLLAGPYCEGRVTDLRALLLFSRQAFGQQALDAMHTHFLQHASFLAAAARDFAFLPTGTQCLLER
jgi:hypothetical protein